MLAGNVRPEDKRGWAREKRRNKGGRALSRREREQQQPTRVNTIFPGTVTFLQHTDNRSTCCKLQSQAKETKSEAGELRSAQQPLITDGKIRTSGFFWPGYL